MTEVYVKIGQNSTCIAIYSAKKVNGEAVNKNRAKIRKEDATWGYIWNSKDFSWTMWKEQ